MKNDKRTLHMVRCDLVELFDAWENPDTVARVSINLEDVARALIDIGLRMYKSHNTELLQMYFDGAKDALHTFAGVDVEMDIYNNGLIDIEVKHGGRVVHHCWEVDRAFL